MKYISPMFISIGFQVGLNIFLTPILNTLHEANRKSGITYFRTICVQFLAFFPQSISRVFFQMRQWQWKYKVYVRRHKDVLDPTQSHLILDQAVVRGRLKLKLIFTNWNIITLRENVHQNR